MQKLFQLSRIKVGTLLLLNQLLPFAAPLDIFSQAARANETAHPQNELVVSYAEGAKKMQLYRINEDGSSRRQITNSTEDCSMPSWSPDGKKIVYLQDTAAGKALWLTDPDGKKTRQLLGSGINMEPSWLPDSKHIVCFALSPGKNKFGTLYIMNTDTLQL